MSSRSKQKKLKKEKEEKHIESLKSFYDEILQTLDTIKQDYLKSKMIAQGPSMEEETKN